MTTQQLRQSIQVISFHSHSDGGEIKYILDKEVKSLVYNNIGLYSALLDCGSVEEDMPAEEWADYNLSQWDALSIAIRHEYEEFVKEEIANSDIGKAIDRLK